MIEGVSLDIEPARFSTFADLAHYCYHVASVVGLCCLHIWGYRSEGGKAEKLAEDCGLALQLTNILRDLGADARDGRIYLPADDLDALRSGTSRARVRAVAEQPASFAPGFRGRARLCLLPSCWGS